VYWCIGVLVYWCIGVLSYGRMVVWTGDKNRNGFDIVVLIANKLKYI